VDVAGTYDYKKDHWEHKIHKTCDAGQRQMIIDAIAEAGYLANALKAWKPGGAYQNSLDKYMGDGTNGAQKKAVQATIDRQFNLHQAINPAGISIEVYCDEKTHRVSQDLCYRSPNTAAYSWETARTGGQMTHFVVLCPIFFRQKTLGAMLEQARKYTRTRETIHAVYRSTGSIWMHETFHWGYTVTDPRAEDSFKGKQVYGPSAVAAFAKEQGAKESVKIADSWTIAALSNMMMQSYGLKKPPSEAVTLEAPGDEISPTAPETITNPKDPGEPSPEELAKSFTVVSGQYARINPNDYATKAPSSLPNCDATVPNCDYVSECGNQWIPVESFDHDKRRYIGYRETVNTFCTAASNKQVAAGYSASTYYPVGLYKYGDTRGDPSWGMMELKVTNHQKSDTHEISKDACIGYFFNLASTKNKGKHCYGEINKDTKGGSYQIGKDAITYYTEAHLGNIEEPKGGYGNLYIGDKPPPLPEPPGKVHCNPTDTNGPRLERGNVEDRIKTWCDGLKGKNVKQDATRLEEEKSFGNPTVNQFGAPGGPVKKLTFSANWEKDIKGKDCPATRATDPGQCFDSMTDILNTCQTPDPGNKFAQWGGSKQEDISCVIYKIEIDNLGVPQSS